MSYRFEFIKNFGPLKDIRQVEHKTALFVYIQDRDTDFTDSKYNCYLFNNDTDLYITKDSLFSPNLPFQFIDENLQLKDNVDSKVVEIYEEYKPLFEKFKLKTKLEQEYLNNDEMEETLCKI